MGESFIHHITVAFSAFLLGAFFCVVYDVIRIARLFLGIKNHNVFNKIEKIFLNKFVEKKKIGKVYESVVMGITDIIFFVIISIFMMIFIHIANSGNVRWYIYVMALLGFISYYKTLGKVVISLSLPLVYYIKKAVSSALNTVSYPVRILIVRIKLKLKSRPKKEIKDENTSRNVLLRTGK